MFLTFDAVRFLGRSRANLARFSALFSALFGLTDSYVLVRDLESNLPIVNGKGLSRELSCHTPMDPGTYGRWPQGPTGDGPTGFRRWTQGPTKNQRGQKKPSSSRELEEEGIY